MKRIKQLEKEINTEANKYNSLVQEYQMENSFIMPTLENNDIPKELPPIKEKKQNEGFEL